PGPAMDTLVDAHDHRTVHGLDRDRNGEREVGPYDPPLKDLVRARGELGNEGVASSVLPGEGGPVERQLARSIGALPCLHGYVSRVGVVDHNCGLRNGEAHG